MNVIKTGGNWTIYDDAIESFDKLPAGTYMINFSKMMGYFLTNHNDLEVKETKIYGDTEKKVDKILRSFSLTDRNFGVILSGPKGVGKSLFARVLANKAAENDLPLLICSGYTPGIASFISSIDQEVIILFDEFEKTFSEKDNTDPQEEMLSLFDGVDSGKKLFVVTCNEVRHLNEYLLNRPGRFHYHFTLTNPTAIEVEEYMKDKLDLKYQNLIPQIINFSLGGSLTYDCLRAIAFEINNGYSLEETVQDLNISRDKVLYYDIRIEFEDGQIFLARKACLDFYRDYCREWCQDNNSDIGFSLVFKTSDIKYDPERTIQHLDPDKVTIQYDNSDLEDMTDDQKAFYQTRKVKSVVLHKSTDSYIYRYAV